MQRFYRPNQNSRNSVQNSFFNRHSVVALINPFAEIGGVHIYIKHLMPLYSSHAELFDCNLFYGGKIHASIYLKLQLLIYIFDSGEFFSRYTQFGAGILYLDMPAYKKKSDSKGYNYVQK